VPQILTYPHEALTTKCAVTSIKEAKDADKMVRAARNIVGVDILPANSLNPYAVLAHRNIVITKEALPILAKIFAK